MVSGILSVIDLNEEQNHNNFTIQIAFTTMNYYPYEFTIKLRAILLL